MKNIAMLATLVILTASLVGCTDEEPTPEKDAVSDAVSEDGNSDAVDAASDVTATDASVILIGSDTKGVDAPDASDTAVDAAADVLAVDAPDAASAADASSDATSTDAK